MYRNVNQRVTDKESYLHGNRIGRYHILAYMLISNVWDIFKKVHFWVKFSKQVQQVQKNPLPTTSIEAWSTLYVSFVMRNSPANKFYVFFRVPRLAPFGPLLTFTDAAIYDPRILNTLIINHGNMVSNNSTYLRKYHGSNIIH